METKQEKKLWDKYGHDLPSCSCAGESGTKSNKKHVYKLDLRHYYHHDFFFLC